MVAGAHAAAVVSAPFLRRRRCGGGAGPRRCGRAAAAAARRVAAKAERVEYSFGSVATYDDDGQVQYEDGAGDQVAFALFNAKLASSLGPSGAAGLEEVRGYARLVALAGRLGEGGRSPAEQRALVLQTLLALVPPPVRFLFKLLIKPADWVDRMNAQVTVKAFAWLVGPCEVVPREDDGVLASVKLRKCRYLESAGCTASCVNFCKRPTQAFFTEAFGVHAHLAPDFDDLSCTMTFGRAPPDPDPALAQPCINSCTKGGSSPDSDCACVRLGAD